jgi:hypothetical protein
MVLRAIHASGITIESLFDRPLKTSCGAAVSSRVYVRKVRFRRFGDEPLSHSLKNRCPNLQSFVGYGNILLEVECELIELDGKRGQLRTAAVNLHPDPGISSG